MARELSQILAELNPVYQPQKDAYNQQITNLDPQMQAENQGLEAQKNDSFGQITSGANRRGLLFSGIPLQEQASYLGQSFLPAVANLKAKYAQQRFNLQDAIAKITQDQYLKGQDIYQSELDRDAAERAARAGGGGGGSGGGGFGGFDLDAGGGSTPNAPGATDKFAGVNKQAAANAILGLLKGGNKTVAYNTINAIRASAARGNLYDQYKLQLLDSYRVNSSYGNFLNSLTAPKAAPPKAAPARAPVQTYPGQTAFGQKSLPFIRR